MVDYGDFTKFQVQSMVADYCKEITLGLTGWGVSFTDWVELKGVARHDKLFRLVRMNDQATTAPTVDADGSHAEFKCPKCGGYRFGTDNATKPFDEWVGRCHGVNCGFTWMRTDDCKYMNAEVSGKDRSTSLLKPTSALVEGDDYPGTYSWAFSFGGASELSGSVPEGYSLQVTVTPVKNA